jgi:hypothetical protein
VQGRSLTWSVITGVDNLQAPERRFITDINGRPFPQRIAGNLEGFNYDFQTHIFRMSYTPQQSLGKSEIMVSGASYPRGFIAAIDNGARLEVPDGEGQQSAIHRPLSFDPVRHILSIEMVDMPKPPQKVVLVIEPR